MDKLMGDFSLGLFIWQMVLFLGLIVLLRAFAWKPILAAVEKRENGIKDAMEAAEAAKTEMANLQASNEELLKKAREERDAMLKEARETKDAVVAEAKNKAKEEAEKIMDAARETINAEKAAALVELKKEVAAMSINVAEGIIKKNLASDDQQKELVNTLVDEVALN